MSRKKSKELNGVEISGGSRDSSIDKYEVKRNMDTILEAEEIKSDAKRMKEIRKLMSKHKKAFRSIQEVKEYAQEKYGGVGGKPKKDDDDDMEM